MTHPVAVPGSAPESLSPEEHALIQAEQGLVAEAARDVRRVYGGLLPPDDLESLGHVGFAEALQTHDPSSDTHVLGYARFRIKGAMLDGIRQEAAYARLLGAVRRAAMRSFAGEDGTIDIGRDPPEKCEGALAQLNESAAMEMVLSALAQRDAANQEAAFIEREATVRAHRALKHARGELSKRERGLIEAVYDQGLTLAQVAEKMGVSLKTVKRQHRAIKLRLAALLRQQGITHAVPLVALPQPVLQNPSRRR